jgi:hypothetical protein
MIMDSCMYGMSIAWKILITLPNARKGSKIREFHRYKQYGREML